MSSMLSALPTSSNHILPMLNLLSANAHQHPAPEPYSLNSVFTEETPKIL